MKKLLFLVLAAFPVAAQEDVAVVVNKASTVTHLTKAQLRRMLLAEQSTWPGGGKLTVLIGPAGEAARAAALEKFCGMSEADYAKFQLHANFNGDGKTSVTVMPSAIGVRNLVQITPGAIGILPVSAAGETVKVIKID